MDMPLTERTSVKVLSLAALIEAKASANRPKDIAVLLGVSPKTAESHRTQIMSKLDIHHTAGLVRYAIRRGLIDV